MRSQLCGLVVAALTATTLVVGCAGHTPSAVIPGAESVMVEAPTYKVGDEWRFTGVGYQSRIHIVEVTDDTVVNEREVSIRLGCPSCRVVRDRNLTVLRFVEANGQARAGDQLRFLDFPLRVGKSWEQTLTMNTAGGESSSTYRNRFTVEAYELVKVPAGTFKAFRIRHDQENLSSERRWTAVSWWSPDVRWTIKVGAYRSPSLDAGESVGRELELESYSLK
jgi:hypothetical protein